jgi:imidazolonepropionase-like amidohydrolase
VNARRILLLALLLGLAGAPCHGAAPAKLALQGGRIIPVNGPEIPQGTLLIEQGKITAMGADVKIPYDAVVVDVSGKVLFPGMIAPHSWQGLDRANENLPVTPYLDVYDAIDPSSLYFEDALRRGILAVHVIQGNDCVIGGLSRLVHPIGLTPDEMTIRPAVALKLSTSPKRGSDRMTQMATLREAFLDLEDYLQRLAEQRYEAKLKAEKKEMDVLPEEARKRGRELVRDEHLDDRHRNLVKLKDGRLAAWIYCDQPTDVAPAIKTAKDNGFPDRTVFVLGTEAYRAVDELKQAGRPVVLPEELLHQERDPIIGELHETFVPKVIYEAGLLFALQPSPDASLAETYLTYQAARCVRNGIPREAALRAITLNPARMLGVEDRLGSLEVGKAGDVVVLSGDPLDFNSWVQQAYIGGILAYDRSKDVRLKELLGLEEKAAKQKAEKKKAKAPPAPEEKKKPAEKGEKDAGGQSPKGKPEKPEQEQQEGEEHHQGSPKGSPPDPQAGTPPATSSPAARRIAWPMPSARRRYRWSTSRRVSSVRPAATSAATLPPWTPRHATLRH